MRPSSERDQNTIPDNRKQRVLNIEAEQKNVHSTSEIPGSKPGLKKKKKMQVETIGEPKIKQRAQNCEGGNRNITSDKSVRKHFQGKKWRRET